MDFDLSISHQQVSDQFHTTAHYSPRSKFYHQALPILYRRVEKIFRFARLSRSTKLVESREASELFELLRSSKMSLLDYQKNDCEQQVSQQSDYFSKEFIYTLDNYISMTRD